MSAITFVFTHSILKLRSEKKYSTDTTFGQLKGKIEMTTGTPAPYQEIWIMQDGQKAGRLDADDMKQMGDFGLGNYVVLYIVDTNPRSHLKELSDANLAKVEKYEMDDEEYGQRKDSVRTWKTKILADKKKENQADFEAAELAKAVNEERYKVLAADMKVGDRCEISEERRGEVKYVGEIPSLGGTWIGVNLDEPMGKHTGKVKGKQYFTCPKNHGVFVRPDAIQVGDYPELDMWDEL